MLANDIDPFSAMVRKLQRLRPLSQVDEAAIRALPVRVQSVRANTYLVREGDRVSECCILLDGYACRHKATSGGGRQIVSFHLAGDILDLQHIHLPRADHNVSTIADSVIAWVPVADLKRIALDHPQVTEALWQDTLICASVFREWVLNVGRRDAKSRVAHMLCEFAARRQAAGLGSPERFELPMTQEHIADATGLTSIHVNRMLRALSDEGVIARARREVRIADWPRMQQVADFHPEYLHAAA